MPDTETYQIILLPSQGYWRWVQAARDYAIRFHANLTPNPENAVRFHRPDQVITVANVAGAYPQQGEIIQWLKTVAPEVAVDSLTISSPEALRIRLAERIESGKRFGDGLGDPGFTLLWPTDFEVITQPFGANPQIYRRYGLPAHEGVDIRAPINANVYACADGRVYRVHNGSSNHAYGIHVRIEHEEGFKTIYAHLNKYLVSTGQEVKRGDLIGLADSTGNSSASHLHLTLKKDGATASGETNYPSDIVDPTPYLIFRKEGERFDPVFSRAIWPAQKALVGLHGRSDGPMMAPDWQVVRSARIEALKLTSSARPSDVAEARSINQDMFVLVRLFADFRFRVVRAADFARWVEPDVENFYEHGIRYFEVHNEPNLTAEGNNISWRSGHEFGDWLLEVMGSLRPKFPEAKFGWPGLSPGATFPGIRQSEFEFLESAGPTVAQADWIGCHCYWQTEDEMMSRTGGLNYLNYREEWPDKLIFITEFSNTAPSLDWQVKGNQYVKYYSHLRNQRGLGAAFSFVVSASAGFQHEVWRFENGKPNQIGTLVGARTV